MGNAFQSILNRGVGAIPEEQDQALDSPMNQTPEAPMFSQQENPLPDHNPAWQNIKDKGYQYNKGDPKPDENIFRNWNAGIISTLGLTSDIMKEAINLSPIGMSSKLAGNELIDNTFGETGRELQTSAAEYGIAPFPGQEGKGLGATIARIGGETVVPYVGLAGRGAALGKQGVTAGKNIIDKTALYYAQKPISSLGAETAGVAGAGTGGVLAREAYDESDPWAAAMGEMAGGITGSGLFYARTVPWTLTKKAYGYLFPSKSRGKELASKRLGQLVDDVPEAEARLSGIDTPKGIEMSPAARTRDRELLSLEKSIFEKVPELRGETQIMHKRSLDNLRKLTQVAGDEIEDIVEEGGKLKDTAVFLRERVNHYDNLVEMRVQFGNDLMENELAKMADPNGLMPRQAMKQASLRSKEIVLDTLDDIRKQEDEVWSYVPKNVSGRIDVTEKAYTGILNDWNIKSQADFDLDPKVQKLFGTKDAEGNFIRGSMFQDGGAATAKEIQQARSTVQQAWRNEVKALAPDANKLRRYNEIADALLEDLNNVVGGDARYTEAMQFSRNLNQRFRTGQMAKIIGREGTQAERIPAEDTLDVVLSGRGQTRDLDQMLLAAPETKPELEKYLYASFFDQTTDKKRMNPEAYKLWIEKNAPILERFPEVKAQIATAGRAARLVQKYQATQTALKGELHEAKGRIGLFLNAPPEREIDAIFKSANPKSTMKMLYAHAKTDPKALAGLRHGVGEHLLTKNTSTIQMAGKDSIDIPDGTKMRHFMNQPMNKQVLEEVYSPKEIENLHKIANAYEGLKISLSGDVPVIPITTSAPSLIVDAVVRYIALHGASNATKGMGAGSLMVAGRASSIAGKVATMLQQPNAQRALVAAVGEEKVMKDLLMSLNQKPEEVNKALFRLHAWMASQLGSEAEEEKGME